MQYTDYFKREIDRLGKALYELFAQMLGKRVTTEQEFINLEETPLPWLNGEGPLQTLLERSEEEFTSELLEHWANSEHLDDIKRVLIYMGDQSFALGLKDKWTAYYARALNVINYLEAHSSTIQYADTVQKDRIINLLKQ